VKGRDERVREKKQTMPTQLVGGGHPTPAANKALGARAPQPAAPHASRWAQERQVPGRTSAADVGAVARRAAAADRQGRGDQCGRSGGQQRQTKAERGGASPAVRGAQPCAGGGGGAEQGTTAAAHAPLGGAPRPAARRLSK